MTTNVVSVEVKVSRRSTAFSSRVRRAPRMALAAATGIKTDDTSTTSLTLIGMNDNANKERMERRNFTKEGRKDGSKRERWKERRKGGNKRERWKERRK